MLFGINVQKSYIGAGFNLIVNGVHDKKGRAT